MVTAVGTTTQQTRTLSTFARAVLARGVRWVPARNHDDQPKPLCALPLSRAFPTLSVCVCLCVSVYSA